jgi:cell division septation protein DedD
VTIHRRKFPSALQSLRTALVFLCLSSSGARRSEAQGPPSGSGDSVFQRAQRMANEGNAAAGRALVDSMLAASPEGSMAYADALFWRAALAESTDQARRDYLRLAVEFSLSPRAEDALLRLSQIELARGDRAAARKFLERLALEHPNGPSRAQAAYWMGRVLLDEGTMPAGCASLAEARARVSTSDVELSNQISYYMRQCASVQRIADAARADSVAHADSVAKADSMASAATARRKAAGSASSTRSLKKDAAPGPIWSVQVAAYSTRQEADRLSKRLAVRGYESRVTADNPFRVRIGRFAKRADALTLAQKLKASGMTAIVVEEGRP